MQSNLFARAAYRDSSATVILLPNIFNKLASFLRLAVPECRGVPTEASTRSSELAFRVFQPPRRAVELLHNTILGSILGALDSKISLFSA
jgi:hypothetical protein